ncbi:hypothetical protein ACOSQ3_001015 [Xanthoceras sorbifolium]
MRKRLKMDMDNPLMRKRSLKMDMEGEFHISNQIIDQNIETDHLTNLPDHIIHNILSLINTKEAVRTSVLSKKWRYYWTNIHCLNFNYRSFHRWFFYSGFVAHVLHHRKDLKLLKLKFNCRGDPCEIETYKDAVKRIVFEYVIFHGVEEIETDFIDGFLPIHLQTLKIVKLVHPIGYLTDLTGFATLTTLQLTSVKFNSSNDIFSSCLNLENLFLIHCEAHGMRVTKHITISSPRLVNLEISYFRFYHLNGRILINGPALKFLIFNITYPLRLSIDKCLTLDSVNIHMSYDNFPGFRMQGYVEKMILMGLELSHAKLLTLNFSKKKLILHYNTAEDDTKVVRFDQKTGEKYTWPIGREFDIYQLGTVLTERISKKLSSLEERERTLMIGLAVMCGIAQKHVKFPKWKLPLEVVRK